MTFLAPLLCVLLIVFVRQGRNPWRLPEATMIYLLGYCVLGAVLGSFEAYSHTTCSLVLLAIAVLWAAISRPELPERWEIRLEPARWLRPAPLALLSILALFVVFSQDRFEYIDMINDPGVYANIAKTMVEDGGHWIRPRSVELLSEHPELEDVVFARARLLGTDLQRGTDDTYVYQFLMGWPAVLALGYSLFGFFSYSKISILVAVLAIVWFHSVARIWCSTWVSLALTALMAFNPLLYYFSKWPSTEYYLLTIVFFLAHLGLRGRSNPALIILCLAAIGLTHIGFVMYLPLLALYAVWAALEERRDDLKAIAAASFLLIGILALNWHACEIYVEVIFLENFSSRFPFDPPGIAVMFATILLCIGLFAVSVLRLPRLANGLGRSPWRRRWRILLVPALQISIVILLAQVALMAYRMGWTLALVENMPEALARGGWWTREDDLGKGLSSVLHHSLVSLVLGTSLVFTPLVLMGVFLFEKVPGARFLLRDDAREVEAADLFMACGWALAFAIFFFLRPDVPNNPDWSRYLIPVGVSLVLLWSTRVLSWLRGPWVAVLLTVAMVYTVVFTGFQVRQPIFQGRFDLIRQLDERLPDNALVFTVGELRWVQLFAANALRYDLDAVPIYVGRNEREGRRIMNDVIRALGPVQAYIVSDHPLRLEGADLDTTEITAEDWDYRLYEGIIYPLRAQSTTLSLYVSSWDDPRTEVLRGDPVLDREELSWLSPASFVGFRDFFWSSGRFDIELPTPLPARRVHIETTGHFLGFVPSSTLTLTVNGEITLEVVFDEATEWFDLGSEVRVETLELRSATFVPQELGINSDRRNIGFDVATVSLER